MKHIIITSVVTGVIGAVTFIAVDELRRKVIASAQSPTYNVEGRSVSVVIPALEEQDYLPQLLTSIENQTHRPIEVIVADSSPGRPGELTEEICRHAAATYLYVAALGVAHARNQGAAYAQGDILVFSDADNVFAPDCIESLVASLEEGYIAAHPVECIIDDTGLAAAGAVWTTNWFKRTNNTTRAVAIWSPAFAQIQYDEACDPMQGCREDLKLGKDIIERFGPGSIKLDRDALIGTSARRFKQQGLGPGGPVWEYRGVRNGVLTY